MSISQISSKKAKKKKRLKKSLMKGIKIFLKKKKATSKNMAIKDIRISQKMKNKS